MAVNSDGAVAVTYYDFRNNTTAAGLPTDYFLAHASGNFTNPASWAADEKRLTDLSFNIENAAPTSRGLFLGDYEGLSAAGECFYAFFAQAGASKSNASDIWFRDPPPAPDSSGASMAATTATPSSTFTTTTPFTSIGLSVAAPNTSSLNGSSNTTIGDHAAAFDPRRLMETSAGLIMMPAAKLEDTLPPDSRDVPEAAGDDAGLADSVFSVGWECPPG